MQNYPLFVKTVSSEKDLKFYYTVHTSLDVVEEKISSVSKSSNDLRELYLGLLYPTEDYRVYPLTYLSEYHVVEFLFHNAEWISNEEFC